MSCVVIERIPVVVAREDSGRVTCDFCAASHPRKSPLNRESYCTIPSSMLYTILYQYIFLSLYTVKYT